ncbi:MULTISPECIES: DUF6177 family protein [unclassified Frigoribacterium]|uniref:DUF6177 family protein n=1 Tax=unclassified Frigoribacterium TaxID=2627005 RepID=UPI000701E15C|nr:MULTISPECIES: DUF6177 family protein [unclassified Frigoribacterium]KQO46563.1 hypothetical protein ASF07_02240 [Frigoribacterium sp. Leaf254]KQT38656.1 hypothetical protein ASG28_02240 [Frigoribacterium sp. Leaf415]
MVDAITSRAVRVDSRARVVRLSRPLADLLGRPATGRRVVLVTGERSRLTVGLRAALVAAGGVWAIHDDKGRLRDGLTGVPYADVDAAATEPDVAAAVPALEPLPIIADAVDTTCQLTVDLTVLHRASHDTSLGGAVETLGAAVSGSVPTRWGTTEPLGHVWDCWVLTQHARHQAPETVRVVVEGPHLSATITARVTDHGIEETTALTVDVTEGSLDDAIARLTDALGHIAESSLPTFALVIAREGESDRCVRAVTYPPPNPVALLIGAPSVRRLGLERSALDAERPVVVVGRPRLPAFVVPLGDAATSGWNALHRTLEAVGPERLAQLVASPLLQAWEEDLHELDLLHESSTETAAETETEIERPAEDEA